MPIYLTESEVRELLPMELALERVEASFLAQARGTAVNQTRQRILLPHTSFHYMAAAWANEKIFGMKVYSATRDVLRFLVLLYDAEGGNLLALLEADHLGRLRTGAASGVATKYLARAEASRVGLIGAGRQAWTQLEAISRVRKITAARVYCRNEERRREFTLALSAHLQLEIEPAESAEAAVRHADIVVAATTAREPVVYGAWLSRGAHLNAIGANMANRRELDNEALERASLITVDSLEQTAQESGDLIQGLAHHPQGWRRVVEFHDVVSGKHPGRTSGEQITIFKSCGIALWDVAVAGAVYRRALEQGKGRPWEFVAN